VKNTSPYVLVFENDYSNIFSLVMKVDFEKMPWDIDDGFTAFVAYAYDRAADMNIDLSDYTLKSIAYGGMVIISFD